jgi:predicted ATP-dependent endonuclease of OLD family
VRQCGRRGLEARVVRVEKVEIERFFGLRKLSVELHPELQLVAGANNAGKTSLLRAFEFFVEPRQFAPAQYKPRNAYYGEEGTRSLTRVKIHFGSLTQSEHRAFSPFMRGERLWVEVRTTRKNARTLSASNGEASEAYAAVVERLSLVKIPSVRVGADARAANHAARLTATMQDALVRRRPGPPTSAQKKFAKAGQSALDVVENFLEKSGEALSELLDADGVRFVMPGLEALLVAIVDGVELQTSAGEELFLRDEGTGFQSLLSLGVLHQVGKANARREGLSLFLIEEPEAFLHPQYQRLVVNQILSLPKQSQAIVTTHSPIIVDSVPIRQICRLPRDPGGLQYDWIAEQITDAKAGQLFRYCDAKNSELVFADCVIFCEGITDEGVLRALCRAFLDAPADPRLTIIRTDSKDKAQHFVALARRFGVPYLVVLDKDAYAGSDRTAMKNIARASGADLTNQQVQELVGIGRRRCRSRADAIAARNAANKILAPAHVLTLSADIEAAVVFSFSKTAVLEELGPSRLNHCSSQTIDELERLSGFSMYERLRRAVGSKGWNTGAANKDKCPKPHVLPQLVESRPGRLARGSDLELLLHHIRNMITNGPS